MVEFSSACCFGRGTNSAGERVGRLVRQKHELQMKLKTKVLSVVIAITSLIFVAWFFVFFISSHAVPPDDLKRVVPGMSKSEVTKVLGEPDSISSENSTTFFFYGGFLRGKWCSTTVSFGTDDRVISKFHDH